MHQNGQLALVCFLVVFVLGQCRLSVDDNLEENHIEFYQNRKVLTTTPRPGRFSIFQKRTRPTFRRNNKHETLLTNYKIISNAADDGQINGKRLNKSRASVEFVNIHGSLNRQNTSQNTNQTSSQNDSLNSFDLKPASEVNSSTVNSNDSTDNYLNHNSSRANHIELTQTQQMILAFGHGLKVKREAKCELPKATVVYLNQDREQIKIYMPRATILYRCGQNTGCCERESDRCVAIEQKQVNLYFFVIKLEKEFNELDDNYESLKAARKARKFASFDTNDDGQLKEYEYNLDYTLNGENENSFRLPDNFEDAKMLNQLKSESSYLNTLLNEDNTIKRRLTRSTKSRRRSKDLKLDSISDSIDDGTNELSDVSRSRRNLGSENDAIGESNATGLATRLNSKAPYNFTKNSQRSNRSHIRRSLGGQLRPRQTIEMLTFTNHTRCGCVPA